MDAQGPSPLEVKAAAPTSATRKAGTRTLKASSRLSKRAPKRSGEVWGPYFSQRHNDVQANLARRLDYSNDRVRFQTYGALLESAGPLTGVRCLDAGCGFGDFSRLLVAAGGTVDAFDVVDDTIRSLKATQPGIRWFTADIADLGDVAGGYGLIVAAEVLQYADPATTIRSLFRLLGSGGRLVACVPNAGCPLVAAASNRFAGRYSGISIPDLVKTLSGLSGIARFAWRGATFLEDQALAPYRLTSWKNKPALDPFDGTPNRLHFVATKA